MKRTERKGKRGEMNIKFQKCNSWWWLLSNFGGADILRFAVPIHKVK